MRPWRIHLAFAVLGFSTGFALPFYSDKPDIYPFAVVVSALSGLVEP